MSLLTACIIYVCLLLVLLFLVIIAEHKGLYKLYYWSLISIIVITVWLLILVCFNINKTEKDLIKQANEYKDTYTTYCNGIEIDINNVVIDKYNIYIDDENQKILLTPRG